MFLLLNSAFCWKKVINVDNYIRDARSKRDIFRAYLTMVLNHMRIYHMKTVGVIIEERGLFAYPAYI